MTAGLIHASPTRTPEACSSNLLTTARPGAPREIGGPTRLRPAPTPPPSPGKAAAAGPAGGPGQLLKKPAARAAAKVPTRSGHHLPAPHGTAAPELSHCADEPRPAARSVLRIPSQDPLTAIQTPPRAARRDSYRVGGPSGPAQLRLRPLGCLPEGGPGCGAAAPPRVHRCVRRFATEQCPCGLGTIYTTRGAICC